MNYSSLAILSRCPQAPVPNLGQYDHQAIATSVCSEGQSDPSYFSASDEQQHGGANSLDSDVSSAGVYSDISAQRSTYLPSNVPAASMTVHPLSGQYLPASGISAAAESRSDMSDSLPDLSSRSGFVAAVDDDFDDFKTAAMSLSRGKVSSHCAVSIVHIRNTVSG